MIISVHVECFPSYVQCHTQKHTHVYSVSSDLGTHYKYANSFIGKITCESVLKDTALLGVGMCTCNPDYQAGWGSKSESPKLTWPMQWDPISDTGSNNSKSNYTKVLWHLFHYDHRERSLSIKFLLFKEWCRHKELELLVFCCLVQCKDYACFVCWPLLLAFLHMTGKWRLQVTGGLQVPKDLGLRLLCSMEQPGSCPQQGWVGFMCTVYAPGKWKKDKGPNVCTQWALFST